MRLLLALAMSAVLLFGCGDGSQSPSTTLTVEMLADLQFFDPAATTFEYGLRCGANRNTEDPQLAGELELVGPGLVNGEPGFIWTATADPPPGPCDATVLLRDSEAEVICSQWKEFIVAANAPTQVDIFVGCEL